MLPHTLYSSNETWNVGLIVVSRLATYQKGSSSNRDSDWFVVAEGINAARKLSPQNPPSPHGPTKENETYRTEDAIAWKVYNTKTFW